MSVVSLSLHKSEVQLRTSVNSNDITSEHDITGLYHGSLHLSNLKGYKVIGFLNTSQHGGDFTVCL